MSDQPTSSAEKRLLIVCIVGTGGLLKNSTFKLNRAASPAVVVAMAGFLKTSIIELQRVSLASFSAVVMMDGGFSNDSVFGLRRAAAGSAFLS